MASISFATLHDACPVLGPLASELIQACCLDTNQRAIGELLMRRCSSELPLVGSTRGWMEVIDRVQLAAIRGSGWEIDRIEHAVALANIDWRDVLLQAGFANSLTGHNAWQAAALRTHDLS